MNGRLSGSDHFCLGLGKTLFNSSVCLIDSNDGPKQAELVLTERLNRKKASGSWPKLGLRRLLPRLDLAATSMAENRDVVNPAAYEELLDRGFPFFDSLKQEGLDRFTRRFNSELKFVPHHRCHAMAALAMSPFNRALIVVIDGAGSLKSDLSEDGERADSGDLNSHEECSVYLQDFGRLCCVQKHWQNFEQSSRHSSHFFSNGLGTLYEKSSEFIFNSKRSAGKVMGLAAFGSPLPLKHRRQYLENLDWTRSYCGKDKNEWETSINRALYAEIAATVQHHFEGSLFALLGSLRERFPGYENLILAGGCALNCTTNMKIVEKGLFREVYVPPFPGDEGISFGLASYLFYHRNENAWRPWAHDSQHGYFGPVSSIPTEEEVRTVFAGFEVMRPASIAAHAADILFHDGIIGWFQGRSESGPRALGNRSILARIDRPGLKDLLNQTIKFRESFRPYGCSCLRERAQDYFEVEPGFNNPYMSFAVKTKAAERERLAEVTHVDGTCRMQTVSPRQNPKFYELLRVYGERSELFCLLNTSLNIMGEPIVETVTDAKHFLLNTPIHGMAVGDFYVRKGG